MPKTFYSFCCTAIILLLSVLSAIAEKNITKTVKNEKGNTWEKSNHFEGDILNKSISGSRNGIKDEVSRWPRAVMPFIIGNYQPWQRQLILKAVSILNRVSCVFLRPRERYDKHYISIADRNKGCSSFVGFAGTGAQEVNLASNCFSKLGTILHEFLHALGFYHQQSSYERDRYINILWKNIDPQFNSNFDKYNDAEVTNFGVEYDPKSVMHYSKYAFSENGEPTIELLNRNSQTENLMGQRDGMTEKDVIKLNLMYNCWD